MRPRNSSLLAIGLLVSSTIAPFPAYAATIAIPPLTITQLAHQSFIDSHGVFLGVRDAIFVPGTGYTSDGFTATVTTGDVMEVRIQPPPGKKFLVHSPVSGSGELYFDLYWQAGADISSYAEPHTVTFENLVGPAPTETYSNVSVGDAHHMVTVQKQMTFATAFEFTALVIDVTESHFAPAITETFGPVQSNSGPSFFASGLTSGPLEPILEITDLAVPVTHMSWGALRRLYR